MNIFTKKRLLSALLAIVMVFSIVPVQFAAATEEEIVMDTAGLSEMTILANGEPVLVEKVEACEVLNNPERATSFTEYEPNNSFSLADTIYNNYNVSGRLSNSDPYDYFKFTLSSRSEISLVAVSTYNTLLMGIANSSGTWTDYTTIFHLGQDDGVYLHYVGNDDGDDPILNAGTYYIIVTDGHSSDKSNTYVFGFSYTSASTSHTHSYGSWYTQTAATCSTPGVEARTCSCGAKETRETAINPNAHTMGIWVPDPNNLPTCISAGKEIRYCSGINEDGVGCAHYETRDGDPIDPEAHEIRELLPEAAGCETTGLTAGEGCILCGKVTVAQQVVPATGHAWNDGVETTPGHVTYTCGNCGETREETTGAYVAQIGNKVYTTVWDALMDAKSGDVVEMIADSDERGTTLFMGVGVTLDLNTYDLKADGLIGLKGSYLNTDPGRYSSSGDYGRLYVPKDNLVLTSGTAIASSGKNKVIPIWNGVDAFVMANAHINDYDAGYGLTINQRTKTIDFAFNHVMGGSANTAFLKNGSDDNAMSIIIRLSWATDNGVAYQDFVYNADFVGKVAQGGFNYTFSLVGYDVLNININTLNVTAMYLTDSGIQVPGTVWSLSNAH